MMISFQWLSPDLKVTLDRIMDLIPTFNRLGKEKYKIAHTENSLEKTRELFSLERKW